MWTFGRKITAGFSAVIIMLAAVAAVGAVAMRHSRADLAAYGACVEEAESVHDADAALEQWQAAAQQWAASPEPGAADAVDAAAAAVRRKLAAAIAGAGTGERRRELRELATQAEAYSRAIRELGAIHAAAAREYHEVLLEQCDRLEHQAEQYEYGAITGAGSSAVGGTLVRAAENIGAAVPVYWAADDNDAANRASTSLLLIRNAARGASDAAGLLAEIADSDRLAAGALADIKRLRVQAGDAQARVEAFPPVFHRQLDSLRRSLSDDEAMLRAAATGSQRRSTAAIVGLSLLGVVCGLATAAWLTRSLSRRIGHLTSHLVMDAEATADVAVRSEKVAASLSEGAEEQAAAVAQTRSCVETLAAAAAKTAASAEATLGIAADTLIAAEAGAAQVLEMKAALAAIRATSHEGLKIAHTIDELAFVTNMLALNAAIEAGRAGAAGAGFAVVADEVRNLARRSAGAAQETTERIEAAGEKSSLGGEIGGRVAEHFESIIRKTREVDASARALNEVCRHQQEGIAELRAALGQIDRVTRRTREETARSAETAGTLQNRARELKQVVASMIALVGRRAVPPGESAGPVESAAPSAAQSAVTIRSARPYAIAS